MEQNKSTAAANRPDNLMGARRFGPFFWTQFFGAFNDNLFKNAVVVLFAFRVASSDAADVWVNVAAGLFILPFFLFSGTAGQLADKFDKARLIRWIKAAEVAIMTAGAIAFALDSHLLLLAVLFLMGLQSTLFGPVKYSIIPQHLSESELVRGNAFVEMGTFLAILLGTLVGGLVMALPSGATWVGAAVIGFAILGWFTSTRIPDAPPNAPDLKLDRNPWTPTVEILRSARKNRTVFLAILAISWFWFFGAFFLAQLPGYARDVLGGAETAVTALLAAFSIGIGVGSLLCARLSGGKIELGLVPIGAMGMTLFAIDLFLATPAAGLSAGGATALSWPLARILFDVAALGISGGLFIVPLYVVLQHRSDERHRSRNIAANNVINAFFMIGSAMVAIVLRKIGLATEELFLVAAVLNLLVAAYIFSVVPEFLLRLMAWAIVRLMYRLRGSGLECIPDEGPAVLVSNHVSFIDALIVAAVCRRPVRFVMYHRIFHTPVIGLLFRAVRAIPIAPRHEDPRRMEQAFDAIGEALCGGEVVCIFPEGKVTHDGRLNTFKPGVERILLRNPVPVVPLRLDGLWGSFFSRKDGSPMSRPFRRGVRSAITVTCGEHVAPTHATAAYLEARIQALDTTPASRPGCFES